MLGWNAMYYCILNFLSTSIYDLVLLNVCHFHHHQVTFPQIRPLSRYSCLHLGSLHPRIFNVIYGKAISNSLRKPSQETHVK